MLCWSQNPDPNENGTQDPPLRLSTTPVWLWRVVHFLAVREERAWLMSVHWHPSLPVKAMSDELFTDSLSLLIATPDIIEGSFLVSP